VGFRVWGLGFRGSGFGSRVLGLWLRDLDNGVEHEAVLEILRRRLHRVIPCAVFELFVRLFGHLSLDKS
jgi:hypothetical protein